MFRKWNTCVLTVKSVAGDAVMTESFFACGECLRGRRQRILPRLISHGEIVFDSYHHPALKVAGRGDLTTAGRKDENHHDELEKTAHGYSVTWNVIFIDPCPEPQKTEH